MPEAPAPAEESLNPYEAYYLEQAAMLSRPDEPAGSRNQRRDLESFRLARSGASTDPEHRVSHTGRERAIVVLGVLMLVVVPIAIAALYWRSCTSGG